VGPDAGNGPPKLIEEQEELLERRHGAVLEVMLAEFKRVSRAHEEGGHVGVPTPPVVVERKQQPQALALELREAALEHFRRIQGCARCRRELRKRGHPAILAVGLRLPPRGTPAAQLDPRSRVWLVPRSRRKSETRGVSTPP